MCRQHCYQRNLPNKSNLSLLKFTVSIASALGNAQTAQVNKPKRRPSRVSIKVKTRKRKHSILIPVPDGQYGKITHWPETLTNAGIAKRGQD